MVDIDRLDAEVGSSVELTPLLVVDGESVTSEASKLAAIKVSAEVLTYRPFFVLGEVGSPGTYPYSNGLTVLNAVATAGGFTYRADTKRVYIRRAGGGDEEVYQLTTSTAVAPGIARSGA